MSVQGGNVGHHKIPRCKTLRIGAKKTMNALARMADVDRSVITKIERNHRVTEVSAMKVYEALNNLHGGVLRASDEIVLES